MPEQTNPNNIPVPVSPEVAAEQRDNAHAKVQALFAAAELRSPEWALELRAQYEVNPESVIEIADAFDLDQLAGLATPKKIA